MAEKKRKIKSDYSIIFLALVILVILIFIFGQNEKQIETIEDSVVEESAGSGFLEIETFPSDAEIFVDNVNSGKSPITLYNVPVGSHNIVIKKEGYEDFITTLSIEAGRKTFLEADLVLIKPKEVGVIDIVEEENLIEISEESSAINVGKEFLLYYDFSEGKFTDKRNFEQDVFSKRYDKHFVFTRLDPVNIKTISKNIDDVEREDCIGISGQYEWLYSGQSLCVITKEGNIAVIGGIWDRTENAELTWKLFS